MSALRSAFGCALLGTALSAWVVRRSAQRSGLSVKLAVDTLFSMLVAGLVLGHVTQVLLYRLASLRGDWRLLLPGSGGACSLGMLGGALLAAGICLAQQERRREYLDVLALGGSLGWGVGRLGCALQHDHVSARTASRLALVIDGVPRHDLGLYEALLCFALFALLGRLGRRLPSGGRFALAVAVYGVGRFLLDLLREHELRYGPLTPMQCALLALGASVVVLNGARTLRDAQRSALSIR